MIPARVSNTPVKEEDPLLQNPLLDYTRRRIYDPSKVKDNNHLVVIEGLDGVGKTTASVALATKINGISLSSPVNRIARETRSKIDETALKNPTARFDFYRIANIEDSKEHIAPALSAGNNVILDRYTLSTIVGNLAVGASLNDHPAIVSAYGNEPDLVVPSASILLTLDEFTRQQRVEDRLRSKGKKPDSLIDENIVIQQKAQAIYKQLISLGLLEVDITGLEINEVVEKIIETLKLHNIHLI